MWRYSSITFGSSWKSRTSDHWSIPPYEKNWEIQNLNQTSAVSYSWNIWWSMRGIKDQSCFNVVILGDTKSGKTTFVHQCIFGKTKQSYKPTIEDCFSTLARLPGKSSSVSHHHQVMGIYMAVHLPQHHAFKSDGTMYYFLLLWITWNIIW